MFYVSVSTSALEKIRKHTKENPDKEVIGLLTGSMQNNVLIIEDAVTGEILSEKTRAALTPKTMAKIADQIVSGKTKGNVIGWYHSHPGFGVFMSEIDIQTQMTLHQFSPYIVALVFDPTKDEMGIFTMDMQTRSPVPISEDLIHIFNPDEEPIPPKFRYPTPQTQYGVYPTPPTEIRKKPEEEKGKLQRKSKLIYTAITIIAIACLLFTIFYMALLVKPPALEVTVSPESATIFVDFPLQINASINGGVPEYNCTWWVKGTKSNSTQVNENRTNYIFSKEESGTYVIYANVTDKAGNRKTSKNVTITVLPLPVVIDILSPKDGSKIQWGETLLNGTLKFLCYNKTVKDYYLNPLPNTLLEIKYRRPGANSDTIPVYTNHMGFFSYTIRDETYTKRTGSLNISITYKGSQKYQKLSCKILVELVKRDTNLTIIDLKKIQQGVRVEGKLRDVKETGINNVTISLEYFNVTEQKWEPIRNVVTQTEASGSYKLDWNPKPASYTIRTAFTGTDLYKPSTSENKTVRPKINVKIQNDTSLNVKQGESINFTITLNNTGLLEDEINLTFQYKMDKMDASKWNDVSIQTTPIKIGALSFTKIPFTWNTTKVAEADGNGLYDIRVKATYSFGEYETCDLQVKASITYTNER